MLTTLDEIADGIYRISTFVPEIGPDGFTFNQFLLDVEEPLLYHTGMKGLFPLVSREVARLRPLEPLRWVAGGDAVAGVEQKAKDLLAQVDARRELSTSLAHDEANA
jgi:hypothetical protein